MKIKISAFNINIYVRGDSNVTIVFLVKQHFWVYSTKSEYALHLRRGRLAKQGTSIFGARLHVGTCISMRREGNLLCAATHLPDGRLMLTEHTPCG